MLGQRPGIHERLLDQGAGDRGEEERVAAWADEVVLVGLLGRAGPARVHHHDLAAALADAAQPAAHVGSGEQAAVRDQRVCAEHEQVVAAVQVGHGHAQRWPNMRPAATCFGIWSTVLAVKTLLRAERAQQHRVVGEEREVVGRRVPDIRGHGIAAVLLEDRGEPAVDLLEGLVPCRLAKLAVAPYQRRGEAVGVLVQLLQPVSLGTDEAGAEDVIAVAADRGHPLAVEGDLEAAGGFAEGTGPVDDALGHYEHRIIRTACMSAQGLTRPAPSAARSRAPARRRAGGRSRRRARTPPGASARPPRAARTRARGARPRARRIRSAR